jgi:hypothetical protein
LLSNFRLKCTEIVLSASNLKSNFIELDGKLFSRSIDSSKNQLNSMVRKIIKSALNQNYLVDAKRLSWNKNVNNARAFRRRKNLKCVNRVVRSASCYCHLWYIGAHRPPTLMGKKCHSTLNSLVVCALSLNFISCMIMNLCCVFNTRTPRWGDFVGCGTYFKFKLILSLN